MGPHVLQAELDGFTNVVQRPIDCVALAVAAWKRRARRDVTAGLVRSQTGGGQILDADRANVGDATGSEPRLVCVGCETRRSTAKSSGDVRVEWGSVSALLYLSEAAPHYAGVGEGRWEPVRLWVPKDRP